MQATAAAEYAPSIEKCAAHRTSEVSLIFSIDARSLC